MLNYIWLGLVVLAVLMGGFSGHLLEVSNAAFEACKAAVMNIALPLAGVMALWLGLMKLAEKSGLVEILARALRPVLKWLFPDVPATHPAMGSMVILVLGLVDDRRKLSARFKLLVQTIVAVGVAVGGERLRLFDVPAPIGIAVTVVWIGSGCCLNLRMANSRLSDMQFPTAAASSCAGLGPLPPPSGGVSSP